MANRLTLVMVFFSLALVSGCSRSDGWRQIFNGKDLSGWQHVGPGSFVVENGLLRPVSGMGLLWYTREKLSNAQIRLVYKVTNNDDNAGLFIRIPEEPTEPWMPVNRGYEVQIYNAGDDYHVTGVLYSLTKALARPFKSVGEWNTMLITLDGGRTVVELNGVKVTDYTEGQPIPERVHDYEPIRGPRPESGYIGLQNHARENGQDSLVYFKEVAVRPLKK